MKRCGFALSVGLAALVAAGCGSNNAALTPPQPPSPAPSTEYLYVTNNVDHTISAYAINPTTGALTPISGSPFLTDGAPQGMAVDPSGKFLYVANFSTLDVSAYAINPTTGVLTPVSGSPFPAGQAPYDVAVAPGGFVYVANNGDNTVSAYTINATTGALIKVSNSPFSTQGTNPAGITVDPSGNFLFVADYGNGGTGAGVDEFTIASGGALTTGPSYVGSVQHMWGIAVAPNDQFAFFTFESNASLPSGVKMCRFNSATGALSSCGSAATSPSSSDTLYGVAVDPSGKFLYVVDNSTGNILEYAIQSNGNLTSVGSVSAGTNPVSIVADPSDKFVYVANNGSGNISAYAINSTTGALTKVAGSPFKAGNGPWGVLVAK